MAHAPSRTDDAPLRQFQIVSELLETPPLARVYTHADRTGPVTVGEIVTETGVPQGTVYDYVDRLETAGLLRTVATGRPARYATEPVGLTLSTDAGTQTVDATLIAAVARRETNEDLDVFVDRHGLDGLAAALEYAREFVDGTVNARITARELDLSPLEAEIVLQALEPVVRASTGDGGDC